jgi:hypothetical protein
MRIGVCAAAVLGVAMAAGSARAQIGSASTILGGPPPSMIQNKPIDMTHLVATPSMATTQSNFSLASLFRKLTTPGATPTQGTSSLPSPASFPTYSNAKMVGTPPYQLGNPMAARFPFLPVIPILNQVKPITPGGQ